MSPILERFTTTEENPARMAILACPVIRDARASEETSDFPAKLVTVDQLAKLLSDPLVPRAIQARLAITDPRELPVCPAWMVNRV